MSVEEQLKQFFKHNLMEDPVYLKKYLKSHPDNKMAWYLLGREYSEMGESGKAAYCYEQAGEIYTAYEQKDLLPLKQQFEALEKAEPVRDPLSNVTSKDRSFKINWIAMYRILLITAASIAAILYTTLDQRSELTQPDPYHELQTEQHSAAKATEISENVKVYYHSEDSKTSGMAESIADIILPKADKALYSIVVQPKKTSDQKWIDWSKKPTIILAAERDRKGQSVTVHYLDAAACSCQPDSPSRSLQVYADWHQQQEQWIILESAVAAYHKLQNAPLKSTDQISSPYPNNVLPGYTSFMEQALKKMMILDQAKNQDSNNTAKDKPPAMDSISDPNTNDPNTGDKPQSPVNKAADVAQNAIFPAEVQLSEPLRIVIDKSAHRLALVSGHTIIRNYPVGLGGDKTPAGTFTISEKVRSPNGKDNGEFGSRGMSLSGGPYAIHGTNKPDSIGKDESHGCVRMAQADIEELFDMTPLGTSVSIVKEGLPSELISGTERFKLPVLTQETNHKIYKWLG